MANKRNLKKLIRRVCGEIAVEAIIAYQTIPSMSSETVGQILGDVAELQCETLSRISFSFDKSRADSENGAAYRAARRRYNAAAFARLRTDFTEGVNKVLKELNAAIPAEVREANKQ